MCVCGCVSLCVWVCLYVYVCMYEPQSARVYVSARVGALACALPSVCGRMDVQFRLRIHLCVCVCVSLSLCVCVCVCALSCASLYGYAHVGVPIRTTGEANPH
jgi:hypothetical protein